MVETIILFSKQSHKINLTAESRIVQEYRKLMYTLMNSKLDLDYTETGLGVFSQDVNINIKEF